MNYFSETKEIKDVCVLGEDSRFWSAPNLSELLETILVQMENNPHRMGIYGESKLDCRISLNDVAFIYESPRIIENKLYVDVKLMDTPKGRLIIDILTEYCGCILSKNNITTQRRVVDIPSEVYRITLVGIGTLDSDNSVKDYMLSYLNFVSVPFKDAQTTALGT
jgi:hypothetical protein